MYLRNLLSIDSSENMILRYKFLIFLMLTFNFVFLRTNFDHLDKANQNELTFQKAEIFNVRDTMYQGLIGYWQAQRVGKNGTMLERGVLPNKSRYLLIKLFQLVS